MHGKLGRVSLAMAAIAGAALARSNRRAAGARRRRAPAGEGLAAPVPETFETTATSCDGEQAQVLAATSPGNRVSGEPPPGARPYGPQVEPPGSRAIAEGAHQANQRSRPFTWIVVAFIALAFATVGFGLIYLWPGLFIAGIAAVVVGGLAGWAAGIMADRGDPSEAGEAVSTNRM